MEDQQAPLLDQFARSARLLGREGITQLLGTRVAVFGIGGVGGYAVEALARSGVGTLDLFDHDRISITNLNRQIIATYQTLNQYKVDVMRERILSIHPQAVVHANRCFYSQKCVAEVNLSVYDYIIDAVDTVSAKLLLIEQAIALHTPIISCMGTGNKLDPTRLVVGDISETSVCPLARVMRKELKVRGITHVKVLYSREIPCIPIQDGEEIDQRAIPGSVSFVPSVAGLILAAEVIRDLLHLS